MIGTVSEEKKVCDYQMKLDEKIDSMDPDEKKELKAILQELVKKIIDSKEEAV